MTSTPQFRRAGPIVAALALAVWGCTDSPTGPRNGAVPVKPSFAVNASANLDQWANGSPVPTGQSWQNGNLNGNNSQYAEGKAVPFRLALEGLTVGTHIITIQYDFTAGGHKAYDYLASIEATEPNALAQICNQTGPGGRSSLCGPNSNIGAMPGTVSTSEFPWPVDNFSVDGLTVSGAQADGGVPRFLRIYNGTITSITTVSHAGPTDGNSTGEMLVTFQASGAAVQLVWSGHLGKSSYWNNDNPPDGAGQVSGAPWHMRTLNLDGGGAANQDRSIQPSALVEPPAITLTKVADAATVNAGDPIGYTITVQNTGAGDATGFSLTDPLPTGGGISWTIQSQSGPVTCAIASNTLSCPPSGTATFPAGATLTVHITSPTTSASCGVYNNTATVAIGNGTAPPPAGPVSITVNCPDVTVLKTAANGTISAGDVASFTITVTNNGPGTAKGVTLSDPLPAGLSWAENPDNPDCTISSGTLNCSFGDLANGAQRSVTVQATTAAANCGQLHNVATVAATNEPASATGNNTDDADIVVNCGQIQITKVADAGTVSAGDPIGFTLTVTNNGAGNATGVTLTDVLPTNAGLSWSVDGGTGAGFCSIASGTLTCNFGTMAPGASLTVHLTSPTTAASCGTVNNTGNVTTTNDGSGQASASVIVNCPDLSVQKTAGNGTISAGDVASFTITVTNNGQGTAKNVTLNDPLPAGLSWAENPDNPDCSISTGTLQCSFGDLAPGASRSVTVEATTTAASCGTLHNVATTAAANEPGSLLEDNTDDADIVVNCGILDITKTADAGTVSAGSQIGFTLTVTNSGAGNLTGVVLTDVLPTNAGLSWSEDPDNPDCSISAGTLTCNFGTLAAGASRSVHLTSPTTAASCGTVNNTGNVTTTNDGTDQASASVTVQCPDVTVLKTAANSPIDAGATASFTITVTNNGPGTATGVTLNDPLPSGLTWTETPDNPDCSISGSLLTCSFGDLANGASRSVTVSAPTTQANCGTLPNTATVAATNEAAGQQGNNTSSASITVNCPVGGQIAPTATTCSDFNAGIAADLIEVLAGLKAGKINNVAPGVFFYYTKFTSPGGAFVVDIVQTNNGPAGWPNFDFKQDQVVLYSANCTKLTANVTTTAGQAHVSINAPAGTTFIIGVKYETSTVVGQNVGPQGSPLPVTYTYETKIGATTLNNTDTVVLKVKP